MIETAPEKYTRLMTPAIVEGLVDSDGLVGRAPDRTRDARLLTRQARVIDLLERVDWESSGLVGGALDEDPEVPPGTLLSPRNYARRLVEHAFGDSRSLFKLVERSVDYEALPSEDSLGESLVHSAPVLLLVADLDDASKNQLFRVLENPEMAQHYPDSVRLEGEPIDVWHDHRGPRFHWNLEVARWIDERRRSDPRKGCPARQAIIQDAYGKREPLLEYFWNHLAVARYGVGRGRRVRL